MQCDVAVVRNELALVFGLAMSHNRNSIMVQKFASTVLTALFFLPWAVHCEDSLSVKTWGPFRIGQSPGTEIRAQVQSNAKTDLCVKLIAQLGTVQIPESCIDDSDGTRSFALAEVPTPTQGNLLLLMEELLSAAPGTSIDGRFYSVDRAGHIIAVTGRLFPESNSLGASQFLVVLKDINQRSTLCVRILTWTGNFGIFRYYPIHFEGTNDTDAVQWKPPRYEVSIDTNEARRERESHARLAAGDGASDTVHLYAQPSRTQSRQESIRLQPAASIQFLDALEDPIYDRTVWRNPWWLHVKIDGKVGYIHESDFWSIGLPDAG